MNILADRINRSEQNYKRAQLQSLDYQEANVEWERFAVSDSDSSEEEQ